MLLFWRGCLRKVELSSVEDHILCPAVWCKKDPGSFTRRDAASHNLSKSETLRPLLQKSPLAFPLHKFHQSDQSIRIAFTASCCSSHSAAWTHAHTGVPAVRSAAQQGFNMPFQLHFTHVKTQNKSLGNHWFVQVWLQFFMSGLKLKRQRRFYKATTVCCWVLLQKGSLAPHMSHTVPVSFNSYWYDLYLKKYNVSVINAASEVTNHRTTPHPWCSAARPCRKQRRASAQWLLQLCMIIQQS